MMLIYHMRDVRNPPEQGFWISASSICKILHDETYVWKASRKSKAVIFTPQTSIACINYSHAFRRLYEKSGASEETKRLLFGDESTYTMDQIPAMVWALRGHGARIQGNDGKGGVSIFLFLNGSGEVYHMHANIGQSNHMVVYEQLDALIKHLDEDLGTDAGFLLVVDNAKHHHKALREMTTDWSYYPPSCPDQASLLDAEVQPVPLDPSLMSGSKARAQFYIPKKPTDALSDNGRYVLMTAAGMASFQLREFHFSHLKERIERLPETATGHTTTFHGDKDALEAMIKSTP